MESTSEEIRGPGVNKRLWTEEEDDKFVEALLEVHNEGRYKADRGFKPGHAVAVERKLATSLPNSGLKANPHITSRIKTLKIHFNTVYDMLNGANTSGFGYDEARGCLVAEKPVGDAYLKVHKAAKMFKDKPFLNYHELCTIFGKDRATGKDAETPADVVEELGGDTNDNMFDGMDVSMSFGTSSTEGSSKKKRKRSSSVDDMICEAMTSSASLMSSKIKSSSKRISRAIEDATSKDLKRMLNGELMKLSGLSIVERHRATVQIGRDSDLTEIFFTIDDHEREAWVKAIIS